MVMGCVVVTVAQHLCDGLLWPNLRVARENALPIGVICHAFLSCGHCKIRAAARPRELYYTRFGEPGDRAVGVPSAARALLGAPRLTIKPNSQH